MIRRPPRSTRVRSSAASDVYKRQMRSKYTTDSNYRAAWSQKMRSKYTTDSNYRAAWRQKMRSKMWSKYTTDSNYRAARRKKMRQQKQKLQQKHKLKRCTDPVAVFSAHIQEGPVCTCMSCHRHLYRQSVVRFDASRYKPASQELLTTMLAAFKSKTDDQLYICCLLYTSPSPRD